MLPRSYRDFVVAFIALRDAALEKLKPARDEAPSGVRIQPARWRHHAGDSPYVTLQLASLPELVEYPGCQFSGRRLRMGTGGACLDIDGDGTEAG